MAKLPQPPERDARKELAETAAYSAAGQSTADHGAAAPGASQGYDFPIDFGRYRLTRLLGEGGMGVVFLADDTQLERRVALKTLKFAAAEDSTHVQRFRREARVAAALQHPDLCPVIDLGQRDGVWFIVMPFVEGLSLAELLRRDGALAPAAAGKMVRRIAKALAAAHAAGVVHRDLKPANVMVRKEPRGAPLVMDFGLAAQPERTDDRLTASGATMGTPHYMAPEQIGGDHAEIGPATDVYALGATLHELLVGVPPFADAKSGSELFRRALAEAPAPPSQLRPGLTPAFDAVCAKALAKRPADRYASMAEFAAALEGPLAGLASGATMVPTVTAAAALTLEWAPEQVPRRSVAPMPARPAARRWLWPAAAATGLALLGAGWVVLQPRAELAAPATLPIAKAEPPVAMAEPPVAATRLLPAGSKWRGTFVFRAPLTESGDALLEVAHRHGPTVAGVYSTRGGAFSWEVSGTVDAAGEVRLKLGKALKQFKDVKAANQALLTGKLSGDTLTAVFDHRPDIADMTLRRDAAR